MLTQIEKKYFEMITPKIEMGSKSDETYTRCCPICREGNSFPRKKRFYMYNKSGMKFTLVHCFNCGYHKSFNNFLKEYYPSECQMMKSEVKGEKLLSLSKLKKSSDLTSDLNSNINLNDLDFSKNLKEDSFNKPKKLFEIPKEFQKLPVSAVLYLQKRAIPEKYYKDWYYCNSKVTLFDKELYLKDYIIIPFYYKNLLYGFQALKYIEKKFYIYLPAENYKIWNLYDIDTNKTIYVAESIYDAISSGFDKIQIISSLGVSLPKEISKKLNVVYCLDNQIIDETSYKESLKLLDEGKKVFIWPKKSEKFKDFNDLAKAGVKPEKIRRLIENNIYSGFEGKIKLKLNKG